MARGGVWRARRRRGADGAEPGVAGALPAVVRAHQHGPPAAALGLRAAGGSLQPQPARPQRALERRGQ